MGVFAVYAFETSEQAIRDRVSFEVESSLSGAEKQFQAELRNVSRVAEFLADYAEDAPDEYIGSAEMEKILRLSVEHYDMIVGCGIFYEPYMGTSDRTNEGYYAYLINGEIYYSDDYTTDIFSRAEPGYRNFYEQNWYRCGADNGGEIGWSGIVFFDPLPQVDMFSTAVAFFDKDGSVRGIGEADISVSQVRDIVHDIEIGATGKAFLIGTNGQYIAWDDDEKTVEMSIADDPEHLELWNMLEDGRTEGTVTIDGEEKIVYIRPSEMLGWKLGVMIDNAELSGDIRRRFMGAAFIPVIGMLLICAACLMLLRYFKRVIVKVERFCDLDSEHSAIEVTERDEFGIMERKLNDMRTILRESVKKAESASIAKSEFLSRMSHEIRTPMNAIIGMTTLAMKTNDPGKIKTYLDNTNESAHRLLAIINDVLDMSKIESGRLSIAANEFDFTKMCENAINVMAEQAREKRIELKHDYHFRFNRCMYADELRISQVIVNHLSNAVKFTPEGGEVRLDADAETRGNKHFLTVKVSDTGIGIAPENLDKLFNSFEQADNSITRRFGGTGLGLAICKRIIELLGGSISVKSEVGAGSVFAFEVPFSWGADLSAVKDGKTAANIAVLVVDDEKSITEYFEELLKMYGITADTANDGETAIAKAADREYDIVFLDWFMPGLTGSDVAKKIREITPSSKIIMISSYDWAEISHTVRDFGVTDFISKPVPPSDIYSKIVQAVNISTVTGDDTDFSGKRLLLVEDVEMNRMIVNGLLEDSGCIIDEAENGQIAVDLVKEHTYDLVLMDMQMPVMDGLTATREIRAFNTSVPIIAMTANAFKEDADRCIAAGMNGHIAKPLDTDVFMRVLRQWLSVR
jgi:signal transduction histidine kinase/DNA-binding response OmpR family regulator